MDIIGVVFVVMVVIICSVFGIFFIVVENEGKVVKFNFYVFCWFFDLELIWCSFSDNLYCW